MNLFFPFFLLTLLLTTCGGVPLPRKSTNVKRSPTNFPSDDKVKEETGVSRSWFFTPFMGFSSDDNSSFDYEKPVSVASDVAKENEYNSDEDDDYQEKDNEYDADNDEEETKNEKELSNAAANGNSKVNDEVVSNTKPIFKVDEPEVNTARLNDKEKSLEEDDSQKTKSKEISGFSTSIGQENTNNGLKSGDSTSQEPSVVPDINEDSSKSEGGVDSAPSSDDTTEAQESEESNVTNDSEENDGIEYNYSEAGEAGEDANSQQSKQGEVTGDDQEQEGNQSTATSQDSNENEDNTNEGDATTSSPSPSGNSLDGDEDENQSQENESSQSSTSDKDSSEQVDTKNSDSNGNSNQNGPMSPNNESNDESSDDEMTSSLNANAQSIPSGVPSPTGDSQNDNSIQNSNQNTESSGGINSKESDANNNVNNGEPTNGDGSSSSTTVSSNPSQPFRQTSTTAAQTSATVSNNNNLPQNAPSHTNPLNNSQPVMNIDNDNDEDDDDDYKEDKNGSEDDDAGEDESDDDAKFRALRRHPLDATLIDDIDEKLDDADLRSRIHAHPKHLIGLSPGGFGGFAGYGGYGGYGGGVPGIGPYGFVGTNMPGFPSGYPLGTKWKMTDHGYTLDRTGFQHPLSPHSACNCGPFGCMCAPLPNTEKGKRRTSKEIRGHGSIEKEKKDDVPKTMETSCKCGPLGCGCEPAPNKREDTSSKREDVPSSPNPIDLAIGWPFGYGPTFGWGPGLRPLPSPCTTTKRSDTKKIGNTPRKRCVDAYSPNMGNSFAAEPFMGWPFGLHSNVGFGWPFSGWYKYLQIFLPFSSLISIMLNKVAKRK